MIDKYMDIKTFEMDTLNQLEDSEKRELSQLLKDYKSQLEDEDNYFTCSICLKIILEPKECSDCHSAFCNKCLHQWTTKGENPKKCPM